MKIKAHKEVSCGLAIKPGTDEKVLEEYIDFLDYEMRIDQRSHPLAKFFSCINLSDSLSFRVQGILPLQ